MTCEYCFILARAGNLQFNYLLIFYKNILLIISCSILGHEGIIEVIDHARPTGAKLKKGDRLTFHVVNCCGECERCKDGLQQKCLSLFKVRSSTVVI